MKRPTNRDLAREARELGLTVRDQGGDLVVVLPGVTSVRLAMGSHANHEVGHQVARRWRLILGHIKQPLTSALPGRILGS